MVIYTRHLALTLGIAALIAACSKSDPQSSGAGTNEASGTSKTAAASVDMAAAQATYQERCATCHGASGRGDGPGATALTPKPRNFADKSWHTTDEKIGLAITMGGVAVGKSPMMPASPDLEQKPEVVEGLVQVVRGFAKGSR